MILQPAYSTSLCKQAIVLVELIEFFENKEDNTNGT